MEETSRRKKTKNACDENIRSTERDTCGWERRERVEGEGEGEGGENTIWGIDPTLQSGVVFFMGG